MNRKSKKDKQQKTSTPGIFIDLRTDFGFKTVLSDKEMLISLLNALIQQRHPNVRIVDLTYLRVEQLGVREEERRIIFDIYCETDDGMHIVVEMQNVVSRNFVNRMIYYLTYPIRNQMPDRKKKAKQEQTKDEPSEKWDYKLNPVYEIIITDAPVFHDEESKDVPVEWVQLMRLHGNVPFSDKVNLIFVDLSKANKTAEDLKTVLDFWLYTFKHAGHLLALPEQMMNNSTFVKLYNKLLRVDNLNQKDMKAYKKSVLDLETMRTYLDDGQERAEARGEARGIAIGEARGETKALTAFVFSCAAMGMSLKTIAAATKLSVEQVEAILQNRK